MYYEITHPLVKHKLTVLRNNVTLHTQFRELISEITLLLAYEAMRNLETEPFKVETPLAGTIGAKVHSDIVVIPILRAGMGMMEGILALVPSARVGFVGIYPDPVSQQPVSYAEKLPQGLKDPHYFVIDPMLATGNSIVAAIDSLKENNCTPITVISIISAPEGIKRVEETHPDVDIYTASIDECLDNKNYIVPGLGNVGDRLFGTE
ncbi:MAG: uracil phosphoribosyltransferase [Acidobacteria bacterium]|jgi:uracil phosphoribosyltransferase|nr:uracil phosphoribosyltransferase [Acidobacteriota bacterium]